MRPNTCLRYQTNSEILPSSRTFLSLSVFNWFCVLLGGDYSLILLLKEYYITVQSKLIRTGKKPEGESMIFK